MNGISVKLPLQPDVKDGLYLTNKTYKEAIKQNFKNLLLTDPGERVMDISFGVGLRKFLFEQKSDELFSLIKKKITEQVSSYVPYVTIQNIIIIDNKENNDNLLSIRIEYSIPSISQEDFIII